MKQHPQDRLIAELGYRPPHCPQCGKRVPETPVELPSEGSCCSGCGQVDYWSEKWKMLLILAVLAAVFLWSRYSPPPDF